MTRATIESEWVHLPAAAALNHPLAQRLGGVWWVVGWMVLLACAGVYWLVVLVGDRGRVGLGVGPMLGYLTLIVLGLAVIALAALAVALLIGRHPWARGVVWAGLVITFPASLPLIVYWADGLRPNLIYAHRFERLVLPPQGAP